MKKLLLLLASLAVATACTPQNNPKPEPTGEMYLNKTVATMKYGDTIHLDVINAPSDAAISWNIADESTIFHIENGVIGALSIGTQNVIVKANERIFNCLVTVEKTYDQCVFKLPFLEFGLDSTAVNYSSLELGFEYEGTQFNEDKTTADLLYYNGNVTTQYGHNYNHSVNLVPLDGVEGLTQVMVIVPTEDEKDVTAFYVSFAERHCSLGEDAETGLEIFQDRDRKYSVLVGAYTLGNLHALGCTYINVQEWKTNAPALVRKAQPMSKLPIVDAPQSVKDALAKQGLRKAIGR